MLKKITTNLLQLIFPVECLGCAREGRWICDLCLSMIPAVRLRCPRCDEPAIEGKTCHACQAYCSLDGLWVAMPFEEPLVQSCVHLLKYSGVTDMRGDLLHIFSRRLKAFTSSGAYERLILPIPLHPRRERERGFNQAAILAKIVATCLNGRYVSDILKRCRNTATQTALSKQQRMSNLSGAFVVSDQLAVSDKHVILVDDVATTGATLEEAARILKMSGAKTIWGVTLARGSYTKNPDGLLGDNKGK